MPAVPASLAFGPGSGGVGIDLPGDAPMTAPGVDLVAGSLPSLRAAALEIVGTFVLAAAGVWLAGQGLLRIFRPAVERAAAGVTAAKTGGLG
jgi:hypothetical protein